MSTCDASKETTVKHHRTAGGVVLDAEGRMLVLVRDVVRDGATVHEVRLPKGHIDPGETEEQAARREAEAAEERRRQEEAEAEAKKAAKKKWRCVLYLLHHLIKS